MTTLKREQVKESSVCIEKILVAVDLTEHSEKTIAYAAQLAESLDASIVLIHVFEGQPFYDYPTEYSIELMGDKRRDNEMRLADFVEKVREMGIRCESAFLEGEPAERITALAREMGADLIVTASHHPTFLARLLNLDKARQIMHRTPCPVLVYHE
jgi:nucleotide-binding universal stress UspA family protein